MVDAKQMSLTEIVNKNKSKNVNEEEKNKNVYLSLLGFKVRKFGAKKDKTPYEFDKIPNLSKNSEYFNMIEILNHLLEKHSDLKIEDEDKAIVFDIIPEFSGEDHICGSIKYGSDRDKKIELNWDTLKEEREIKENIVTRDYYFLLKLPENTSIGCLILERKGSAGIQDLFMKWMRESIKLYGDYKHVHPEIYDMNPKEVRKYYEEGIVIRFDYIYEDISSDAFKESSLTPKKFIVRIPVENKKNISAPSLMGEFKKKLPWVEGKPSEIKVLSKYKSKKKTFDINNEGKVKPYVEISDNLFWEDYDENRNPKFKSIDREARKIMNNNFKDLWNGDIVE